MIKQALALFALTAALPLTATLILVIKGVPDLDKAVSQQCKNHAWPTNAHQVHMDWCKANNYPTK